MKTKTYLSSRTLIAVNLAILLVSCAKSNLGLISGTTGSFSSRYPPTFSQNAQANLKSIDSVISELMNMPKPDGVSEEDYRLIKEALRAELISHGISRLALKAPTGAVNKVNDISITDNRNGTVDISWSYRNQGDYNQDGTVNISDVSILATHFHRKKNPQTLEWDDPVDEVIDGDGSGVINISDVSPLALGFFSNVSFYRLFGAPSPEGPFTPIVDIPFLSGTGAGRKIFTAEDISSPPNFLKVQPFDSRGNGGIESDIVPLSAEEPPHILGVAPLRGQAGESVTFIATVVGTPPFTYLWDFGGGASPNTSSDETPSVTLSFTPAIYQASLSVSNEFGSDTLNFDLEVFAEQTLSLALGEVIELAGITGEENLLLSTSEDEEYVLVLSGISQVEEGNVPPDFTAEVGYGAGGVSKMTHSIQRHNFSRGLRGDYHQSDIHTKSELEEILKKIPKKRKAVQRRVSNIGDTRLFRFAFNPSAEAKTATLRAEASLCELWVDDRVPLSGEDGISTSFLNTMVGYVNDVIIPRELEKFGALYEPDNDGKLIILFTIEINKLPGAIGGFFSEKDFFPEVYPEGNGADIVYVQVPDTRGVYDSGWIVTQEEFQASAPAIVAHELQHLINSSNHIRFWETHGGPQFFEEFWLNEALSHFAEDFTGFQPPNNFTSPEAFLSTSPWVYLPGGDEENPIPERRGAGYLFLRYLIDRFGSSILSDLSMRDEDVEILKGWENVENACGAPLGELLLSWGMAMELSSLNVDPQNSVYTYRPVSIDSQTQAQHGIRFRSMNQPFSGEAKAVSEPLFFTLSPDTASSLALTAKVNTLLFFRLVNLTPRNSARLSIRNSSPYPISALLARVDTGEFLAEPAGDLTPGKVVLANLSSPSELDEFNLQGVAGFYIFRLVALSPTIENFTFTIVDTEFPNMVFHPYNSDEPPPGVYIARIEIQNSGTYPLKIASTNNQTGWYSFQVIEAR